MEFNSQKFQKKDLNYSKIEKSFDTFNKNTELSVDLNYNYPTENSRNYIEEEFQEIINLFDEHDNYNRIASLESYSDVTVLSALSNPTKYNLNSEDIETIKDIFLFFEEELGLEFKKNEKINLTFERILEILQENYGIAYGNILYENKNNGFGFGGKKLANYVSNYSKIYKFLIKLVKPPYRLKNSKK